MKQEEPAMSDERPPVTTTDAGIPAGNDAHSLTVGPDGPILLQDHYVIEQMANFNRERIPERQPHAKGGGAFGSLGSNLRRDGLAVDDRGGHVRHPRGSNVAAVSSA